MIVLTRNQVREIDRRAIEEYHMSSLVLMENAGRHATDIMLEHLQWPGRPPVCIYCGTGNNGGDGFVIARHLRNRGFSVEVVLTASEDRLSADAAANHRIIQAMAIPIYPLDLSTTAIHLTKCKVVVDAILGTGFQGQLKPPLPQLIQQINERDDIMRVSVDIPSGLDCDSGQPQPSAIHADLTVSFVANKSGFLQSTASRYTGEIAIADIGAPVQLLDAVIKNPPASAPIKPSRPHIS